MSQGSRDGVMIAFKDHRVRLLVATDIAARGLDIEHVTHVINYDVPDSSEIYVHRIGRTGRVGRTGRAITLVTPSQREEIGRIERDVKTSIGEWESPEERLEHAPRPRRRERRRESRPATPKEAPRRAAPSSSSTAASAAASPRRTCAGRCARAPSCPRRRSTTSASCTASPSSRSPRPGRPHRRVPRRHQAARQGDPPRAGEGLTPTASARRCGRRAGRSRSAW